MKRIRLLALLWLASSLSMAQTVTVISAHLVDSSGAAISGYVYFQPTLCYSGQPTSYHMPGGGTVMSSAVPVVVTTGALSVTLPDTTQTFPANICFAMTYPQGSLANGYNLLQPHTTAYNSSDWCQAGICNLDNYLPGTQPLPTINAVQSINYIGGQLTFQGTGVSQNGNTFTFTTGGGLGSFTSGNLSPLFTTSLGAEPTTNPALAFTASSVPQSAALIGPASGGTGAYSFRAIQSTDLPTVDVGQGGLGTATAPSTAQIPIAQSSSAYAPETVSGDFTLSSNGVGALASVNLDVGACGSSTAIPTVTLNGKGLATACVTNAVIAPAGTLTGTALASNVVNSSLTSAAGGSFGTGAFAAVYVLPAATSSVLGGVKPDGTTIANSSGAISCATATTSQLGCMKPDGSTITISNGVISSVGLASGALGSAPYQSGANATAFIASPTTSGHEFVYSWAPSGSTIAPVALDLGSFLGTNITASSPIVATPSMLGTVISCPTCGTSSGGTTVTVNGGGSLGSLNINATAPIADSSYLALLPKISGANMILEAPYGTNTTQGVLSGDNATLSVSAGAIGLNLANANTWTATQAFPSSSITNAELAHSTISGIALGSNLDTLTFGTHLASGGSSYNGSANETITSDATNADTASTIVARDSSGNFSAGTITATLSGNATTATTASNLGGTITYSLPYQSASATTSYLSPQTTNNDYALIEHVTGSAAVAPSWSNAPALAVTNMTGTGAFSITGTSGGLTGTPNISVGNLAASGTVTFTGIEPGSGGPNCLQISSAGAVTQTGSACGSGSGGVTSFSGDGALLNNSSSTGAVTATLANTGVGYGVWGNTGSSSGAPGYHALSAYPAAAFPSTVVFNNQANTYTTGLQNLASATFELPEAASYAPTTAALFGYDSTNNRAVLGNGTNTSYIPWFTGTLTSLDIPEFSGTLGLIADSSVAVDNLTQTTSTPAANQLCVFGSTAKTCTPATTLPTAAFPALTGDVTNPSGSLATTVGAIKGAAVPTLAAGYLYYSGSAFSWSTPSGSGTVNSGTANQIGYYAATGTAISGENQVAMNQGGFGQDVSAQTGFPYFTSGTLQWIPGNSVTNESSSFTIASTGGSYYRVNSSSGVTATTPTSAGIGMNAVIQNIGTANITMAAGSGATYTGVTTIYPGQALFVYWNTNDSAFESGPLIVYSSDFTFTPSLTGNTLALNLGQAHTWTATQTQPAPLLSNVTGSTQCLHVNSTGQVSGTGSDCGSGSGGITGSAVVNQAVNGTGSTAIASGFTDTAGTITTGDIAAYTSSGTIGNCTTTPCVNSLGVFNTSTTWIASGEVTVNLDGTYTVTAGEIVCNSASGATGHPTGSSDCAPGQRIGYVKTAASSVTTATVDLVRN